MEVQIWQTMGQAQLSEKMRGEQDIRTLATSIIQQVCHYLQAQTGILYIAEDQYLKPMGRYAYSQVKPTDRFKFGEDFVGQAALEKRRLFVKNVPEGYLTVRSGLGKRPPKNILLFPFIYNDRVVGVIELGTLGEFSQTQMEFIETALDSIAIAFNTAQDRARIDELLNQSRQQADDLQTQEEKLRGIDEELEVQTDNGSPRQK
jgi:GAF domain-containing protein